MLSTKVHAVTISAMGRKNAVMVGFIVLLLSTGALGLLEFIDYGNWKLFYGLAMAIRFTQGYADSLISTTQYSIVSQTYKENKA